VGRLAARGGGAPGRRAGAEPLAAVVTMGKRDRDSSSSSSPRRDRRRKEKEKEKKKGKDKDRGKRDRSGSKDDKRSRSRSDKRRGKDGGKKKRSSSRRRKSRSKSAAKKKSPERKKAKERERSASGSPAKSKADKKPKAASRSASAQVDRDWRNEDNAGTAGAAEQPQAAPAAPEPAKESTPAAPSKPPKPAKPAELATVTLDVRPFGMGPSKEAGVEGYVVSKIADGKPASKAGVLVGWRLVRVAGADCREADLDSVSKLLKDAALPMEAVFEKPPVDDFDSDDEDEDEVDDIADERAEHRKITSSHLANLDELPVERTPAEGLPEPITCWQDACGRQLLNADLVKKLQAAGLKRPTLIQRHAIPLVGARNGHYDLIALAQTGSGKTFAFVIPSVARLILQGAMSRPFFPGKSPASPLMLVLSPTRELAMQTQKEIETIKGKLNAVCVYGGETLKYQMQRIEKEQIDILCATPGRLIDLIDGGTISLSFIQTVVLDEADQMLEQSLEVMCAEILTGRDMPEPKSGRQTLLFSATMPQKIKDLCPKILRPGQIAELKIGHYGDDQGGSCKDIRQLLKWIPDEQQRVGALIQDLRDLWLTAGKKGRVVVFTNQRLQAGVLAGALQGQGYTVLHLHGKLDQHVREEVFDKFRRGQADVLVATNVASRGLDFPDISFVVQYNLPQTIDIYTHRIGRTGRVGQVGCALGYVGPKDRNLFVKLVEFLQLNEQEVPPFLLRQDLAKGGGKSKGHGRPFR